MLLLYSTSLLTHKIRCMILNTMLLCCAAYEGDTSMVMQLLNTTQASPNALGLKLVYYCMYHVMSSDPVGIRMLYIMQHLQVMKR